MRTLISGMIISATFLAACSNNAPKATTAESDSSKTLIESGSKEAKSTNTFSIGKIVDSYLQMKNAFTKDNDKDAAAAGDEMVKIFAGFDKSSLSAEQSKSYANITDDAKEHAEHIGANSGNIEHQREHFDMLSKDMYDLVKLFGAGQSLYLDHCPMYNNKKGADWLSETKEIKNPYLGKAMPDCGSVKEELKM